MTEILLKKTGTEKRLGLCIYSFWKYRDHPREIEAKIMQLKILAFLKKEGWEIVE